MSNHTTEARRLSGRPRRTRTLRGALGVTLLGAVVPGAGFLWARRLALGLLVLAPALAIAAAVPFQVRDLHTALDLAFDPGRLRVALGSWAGCSLLWAATVVATYVLVRPRPLSRPARRLGRLAFVLLIAWRWRPRSASVPRYAIVQADLVTTSSRATGPRPRRST